MSRPNHKMFSFDKARWAVLAGALGVGLATLWPSVASGVEYRIGPNAEVDSASDGGEGTITVSWSLVTEAHVEYLQPYPDEVCVEWAAVVDGERGSSTNTCFTTETSNQADLEVDTGIGGETRAVYAVLLHVYYNDIRIPPPGWVYTWVEVTLNDDDDAGEAPGAVEPA